MRLIKWSLVTIVLLAILLAVAPLGLKYYSLSWLQKQGYDARLDTFGFNAVTGKVTIAGLHLSDSSGKQISVDLLETYVRLPEFLKKEIVLRRFKTQGLAVHLGGDSSADWSQFSAPLSDVINRRMIDWRVELVNGLNEQLQLCRAHPSNEAAEQCFTLGSLALRDLVVQNTSKGWQLATRSSVQLQRLYFNDPQSGDSLLYVGDMQVRDWVSDQQETRIGQIAVKAFHLVERTDLEAKRLDSPYQTQLDGLLINDIVITDGGEQVRVQLGLVDLTALRQTLHKNSDARIVVLSRLDDVFPGLSQALSQEGHGLLFEVLKTRVVDGAVAWLDDSVVPPAQESLKGLSLELGPISSVQPEKRTPLTFVGRFAEGGEVYVRGRLAPFAEHPNFSLEGHIRGLDLAKISAYTETLFAEKVTQGRLDAKFRAEAQSAVMQGDAAIRFTDLKTLGGANRDGVLSLQESFGRLRTKNNTVDFDIYFDFDLAASTSVAEALGRDVKRTLSAVAQGQQPSKPVKRVVENKALTFESMKYNPNIMELAGTQAIRLRDVAQIANEQPNKTLVLCPVTTGGEWAALYRQGKFKGWEQIPSDEKAHLLDMSRLRAKNLLTQLSEYGVASARVSICEPTLQLSDDGPSFLTAELL